MREPLLPVSGAIGPEYGFPVSRNLWRLAFGVSDVEAVACAAQVPFPPPPDVSLGLVSRVESVLLHEALGEAESE